MADDSFRIKQDRYKKLVDIFGRSVLEDLRS